MKLVHEVSASEAGRTVLSVLGDLLPTVRSADLRELCLLRSVTRDGHVCGAGESLSAGQRLELESEEPLPTIRPAKLKGFELLHLEGDLLACAKPPGIAIEGDRDASGEDLPLRAAVLHALRQAGRDPLPRPRFVHRLDKDTSGALLVALDHATMQRLTAQLAGEAEARVEKSYVALVEGRLGEAEGRVEVPLQVHSGKRKAPVRADAEGKVARTRFERLEVLGRFSWVRLWPETGRTHQLRVHMAHLGHPIVCDRHYGSSEPLLLSKLKRGYVPSRREERPLLARLALHAERLELQGPQGPLKIEAPLPKDLRVTLKQLRKLF
jgi:23S rRNA pseudouridine1911/1915/1917 synthase